NIRRRSSSPCGRRRAPEKLEALGTLSCRTAMGHRARRLLGGGDLLGIFPARPRPQPRLPLGRGWSARPVRSRRPPLLRIGAVEWSRSDSEGALVWPDQRAGQPRRGRQGMLFLPRLDADALVLQGALQISAGRVSLSTARRGEPAPRPERSGV